MPSIPSAHFLHTGMWIWWWGARFHYVDVRVTKSHKSRSLHDLMEQSRPVLSIHPPLRCITVTYYKVILFLFRWLNPYLNSYDSLRKRFPALHFHYILFPSPVWLFCSYLFKCPLPSLHCKSLMAVIVPSLHHDCLVTIRFTINVVTIHVIKNFKNYSDSYNKFNYEYMMHSKHSLDCLLYFFSWSIILHMNA